MSIRENCRHAGVPPRQSLGFSFRQIYGLVYPLDISILTS